MNKKFFEKHRSNSQLIILALFCSSLFSGCKFHSQLETKTVVETQVTRVFRNGFNISYLNSNKSITQSELEAVIIEGAHKGKLIYFTFLQTDILATLDPGDVLVFQIEKRLLKKHVNDMKNIKTSYSQLIDMDIKILSIRKDQRKADRSKD